MKGLRVRLGLILIGIASAVLILTSIVYAIEAHYHIAMFQNESSSRKEMAPLSTHLERAMMESILYTALGAIILVIIISFYAAKRLSTPLLQMKRAADRMAKGRWKTRVSIKGNDELSQLGLSLNQLASELEKQDTARKNMTADIAHELRTPLATLKSHMEAFEDGIWDPTPKRIKDCTEEINRLIHLVQDLEQLNTIEASDFKICRRPSDLETVIEQCAASIRGAFLQKNVDLELFFQGDLEFDFDEERMKQVLFNLLSNSLKYTSPGGSASVLAEDQSGTVLLKVMDNGIGMKAESIQKAFDRFYREDHSRSRRTGGSGIGLAIVKRLVESHQGTIWIESKEGKGTTVSISLPKMNPASS
ncbi:sensor histidine kinase [Peribacillus kribbensis]|uniref:sensor histidine kinase n=1 Tax=Peribacillus kribbensis TaxID=356658 RepID=UPI0003FCD4CA|nr:ATP-binding protein [Peribacillus kribbensis]